MAQSERVFIAQHNLQITFEAAKRALQQIASLEEQDAPHRLIAKTGMNIRTTGDTIIVILQARDAETHVMVKSKSSALIGWGKHDANLEKFGTLFQREIDTLANTFVERPPDNPQPAPSRQTADAPRQIFISYRRADSADICGRIYDHLIKHLGEEKVFKDVDDIPLGVDFRDYLRDTLDQCRAVLVVIGPRWLTLSDDQGQRLAQENDWVRIEVEMALERGIPVVPLLVYGATMPAPDELPDSIRSLAARNGMAIRPDPDFKNDINRLISKLGQ